MTPQEIPETSAGPVRLAHLTALEARRALDSNPRLLVPVGTMIARGPHLPLGSDNLILDRLADDLSAQLGIARAPIIPFGVHSREDPEAPGSTTLTRKTLHRLMNELIAGWETDAKVRDVFILTTHAGEAHLEALSTIRSLGRVTLIDIYATPFPDGGYGGAPDTAILMWIAPTLIDYAQLPRTTARDPEVGERIYRQILDSAAAQINAVSATGAS